MIWQAFDASIAWFVPWRSACDRIDALPRSVDLLVIGGVAFAITAARVTDALVRRRK